MSRDLTPEEVQTLSAAMKKIGAMGFEEFSAAVDAATAAKKAVDAFAATQTDGTALCPRCGRMTVKARLHTNALSRCADVFVCDECGTDEAVRAVSGMELPLKDWAIAKM